MYFRNLSEFWFFFDFLIKNKNESRNYDICVVDYIVDLVLVVREDRMFYFKYLGFLFIFDVLF